MAYIPIVPEKEKCTFQVIKKTPLLNYYKGDMNLLNENGKRLDRDEETFEDTRLVDEMYKDLMDTTIDENIDVNSSESMDTLNAKIRCSDKYTFLFSKIARGPSFTIKL